LGLTTTCRIFLHIYEGDGVETEFNTAEARVIALRLLGLGQALARSKSNTK
jgi:hypothetical protein